MDRRRLMSFALGGPFLASIAEASVQSTQRPGETVTSGRSPELYVWRQYGLRTGTQPRRLAEFLKNAVIPAANRLEHQPIGVFEVVAGPTSPAVFVLTPHQTLESFLTYEKRLAQDQEFLKHGQAYLEAPATEPAYVRQELSLLQAFPNVPRVEVPKATVGDAPRLFELRTYESHSETAHGRKMEMFTKLGELEIFRRCGLTPVFFARTLIGPRMPNFVYMLVHHNLAAREKAWDTFRADAEWKTLAATPGYADTDILSNVTTEFLRPAPYSQI
jgi:hypothetical protein